MKILCTICARGGSGVIKNIKLINKRPLISYTIKQANQIIRQIVIKDQKYSKMRAEIWC